MNEGFLSQEISDMKKEHIWGILFFSGLWGITEAVLGGALYSANVRYASVPLTIIGFIILTFARIYFPQRGTATLIAALAMLYKFLNEPFFACHLLGIFIMGVSYDVVFNVFKIKNQSLCAIVATYFNYALFALMITYLFRYNYWVQGGFGRVLKHIAIAGTMAAVGSAVFVPLSFWLGKILKAKFAMPFRLEFQFASGSISLVTTALWVFGINMYFFS
jgi:ABC-type thiamin/hydroxymethylpyrimidine transport system permease subunit